jgi:hypothetical protein
MRFLTRTILLSLALLPIADLPLRAQDTTGTGAISGTVVDAS